MKIHDFYFNVVIVNACMYYQMCKHLFISISSFSIFFILVLIKQCIHKCDKYVNISLLLSGTHADVNFALNQPTWSQNGHSNLDPSKAVDDDLATFGCSGTEERPFIGVDLGTSLQVRRASFNFAGEYTATSIPVPFQLRCILLLINHFHRAHLREGKQATSRKLSSSVPYLHLFKVAVARDMQAYPWPSRTTQHPVHPTTWLLAAVDPVRLSYSPRFKTSW